MNSLNAKSKIVNQKTVLCAHCSLPVPNELVSRDEATASFCCLACSYVYNIINDLGLDDFYQIKDNFKAEDPRPANIKDSKYKYFDQKEFLDAYVKTTANGLARITFYLPAMHCAACVWLVEKLPEILDGVLEARADFTRFSIDITYWPEKIKLSKIASRLNSFGYAPEPRAVDQQIAKKDNQSNLLRIAVAGISAGNTMLIAVSLYQGFFTGIEERYLTFFQWVSFFLTLPAIFYSAQPFYKAAISGLKARILHIDLPISIGITLGFLASTYNTIQGINHVYFDSVCMLIFLLLIGRYLQKKGVERVFNDNDLLYSVVPLEANKLLEANKIEHVFSGSLEVGEKVVIFPGELIPVDGEILEGSSQIDNSILNGESKPLEVSRGSQVFAGTKNLLSKITIQSCMTVKDSRIAKLIYQSQGSSFKKAKITEMTDYVSAYFVSFVILVSVAVAFYFYPRIGFQATLDRVLAFLIITCPCALGLSAPLGFATAIRKAAKRGIYIKDDQVLERINLVKRIYFDKTGTLTKGEQQVVESYFVKEGEILPLNDLSTLSEQEKEDLQTLVLLESKSSHPSALAICEKFQVFKDQMIVEKLEISLLSSGIEAKLASSGTYRVGSWLWQKSFLANLESLAGTIYQEITSSGLSPVVFAKNDQLIAIFAIGDDLKENAGALLHYLTRRDLELAIVSGDLPEVANSIATKLRVDFYSVLGSLSPEDKLQIIRESQQKRETAMVGDGVNDAAALKAAGVSIAVKGGADVSLRLADVFIAGSSLNLISELFDGSRETISLVKRNLAFSLFYNLVGASAAICGLVNPLVAAIFMPLSSLTVVVSTLFSRVFKEEKVSP